MRSSAAAIVYYCVAVIEILVGLRVLLKFFGANTKTPFVQWIYDLSLVFFYPFEGMFQSFVFTTGSVLETAAIFALIIYLFLGYLVSRLIEILRETLIHPMTKGTDQPSGTAPKEGPRESQPRQSL